MESNKNVEALTNLNNSRDDIVDQVTTLESLVKVRFHAQMPLRNVVPSNSSYQANFYFRLYSRNLLDDLS